MVGAEAHARRECWQTILSRPAARLPLFYVTSFHSNVLDFHLFFCGQCVLEQWTASDYEALQITSLRNSLFISTLSAEKTQNARVPA